MRKIDRYVLGELLVVFGLASLVLVLVYWVNRAVVLFDQLIADGQSAWVFLEFTALALPSIIKIVLPIAAVVATLYAINRLSTDSELTVVQATGASPWRLARPVLAFGLVVGMLVSVLAHALAPASASRLAQRRADIAQTATASLLREGEFLSPAPGLTLYIREVTAEGELRGLMLSDSRDLEGGGDEVLTYTAARAYLVRGEASPQIVMVDGLIQRLDRRGGRLLTTSFADLAYDLGPLMPSATPGRRSPREVLTGELLRAGPGLVAETGRSRGELRAAAHGRLAEALLGPVGALIAFATLMVGRFSRFGLWRRMAGAIVLVIAVKGVESAAAAAVEGAPELWCLLYLPATVGLALAAGLLWFAARPWPGLCAPVGPDPAGPGSAGPDPAAA